MTAWPRLPISFGPEMAGIGMSLASAAMAETKEDVGAALAELGAVAASARTSLIERISAAGEITAEPAKAMASRQPDEIRDALELISQLEEAALNAFQRLADLIQHQKFQRLLLDHPSFDIGALEELVRISYPAHQQAVREARLTLILEAARRAKAAGVSILPDDLDAFKVEFRQMPFAETMGWQETAHIAASPDNAKRVLAAVASTTTDRTADLAGMTVGPA